jgi:hypothetical protein
VWLVASVAIVGASLAVRRGTPVDPKAGTPEAAVAGALSSSGLSCEAGDVVWVDRSQGLFGVMPATGRALLRASATGEPSDLYLVEARFSPAGAVLDIGDAWNLTATSGVDESRPTMRGHVAVYATSADGLYTGVHVLDLGGRALSSYSDFTRLQRTQLAITNLQQTGQVAGIVHDVFALDPVARSVAAEWRDDGTVAVRADDHSIAIRPDEVRVVAGEAFVRVIPDERARPGNLVTWAVDRLRAVSFIGDERMQWIKAVAFTVLDKAHTTFGGATTAQDVRDELGLQPAASSASFVDPEIGWPPAPIKPVFSSPLPGEGQWIGLEKDAFITRTSSGTAPALVTSFIRPDPRRPDARVYMTLWDPRQIALHMEAGTVEPISATGEHGPGMIPRTPEVMNHVVAAFNGGFQAQHGEYGMLANGIEYLPPKPYAATVAELRDGSNVFGSWPAEGAVPDDFVALRQNLTALVQDGKFNPWGRNWWGGTPPGWPDQIHSARSAVCLTEEGFMGYFYSASIAADDLALGMIAARCSFGIHLDMNPGHAGFEFYDVAPEGHLAPLGRALQPDWEAEGKVADMPGYVFRSRRMIRSMGHMLFPRYIQREARDFFYLTMRPLLPGAALVRQAPAHDPSDDDEGVWRMRGLPQHGFPYALATTWLWADAQTRAPCKLRVVRADPRTLSPVPPGGSDAQVVLALAAPTRGSLGLWWSDGLFALSGQPPTRQAILLVRGYPASEAAAETATAAVGVQDEDGMLAWVELPAERHPDASTAVAMDAVLTRMGCSQRMMLPGESRALLGGTLDASGAPAHLPPPTVRLTRGHAPDAHPIFPDTPIVPSRVWQPLQAKRVRYFYKPIAAPSATTSSSGPGAAATPPSTPPPSHP